MFYSEGKKTDLKKTLAVELKYYICWDFKIEKIQSVSF